MTCAIVERMAVLDEDFSIDARLTEGGDGLWSPPGSTPAVAPRDFQSLYEQQRARAEAAEARCEELRWTEVAARSDAGSWKSRFKSCRRRLSEAEEEAKELRSAARDVPSLRAQVVRLEALLSEAGTRSSEAALVGALSKEVARLHDALAASPARRGGAGRQSAGEPAIAGAPKRATDWCRRSPQVAVPPEPLPYPSGSSSRCRYRASPI